MLRTAFHAASSWLVIAFVLAGLRINAVADEPASAPAATELPLGGVTESLLSQLSPEHLKSFAEMLEQDWKDRPEWGDMALAIMKREPMRPGGGWWRASGKRYDWEWLRTKCDANADAVISREELPGEPAARDVWFERLDRDRDGELTAADFDWTKRLTEKPQNTMSDFLFHRLDTDSNGRITADELLDFFKQADREKLGFLTAEDILRRLDDDSDFDPGDGPPAAKRMLKMFFNGELGLFEPGPQVGDVAPDFTLPTHDGQRTVALSDLRGKKPVVLIFGSFT